MAVGRYAEMEESMAENEAAQGSAEVAFLIGRNLSERMKREMRGLLHRLERNKPNLVEGSS
jgi:hypothetical protein